jgi:hypothetical protein
LLCCCLTSLLLWPDNKLFRKKQIDLQNKKKKSNQKKITGFQVFDSNKFLNNLKGGITLYI